MGATDTGGYPCRFSSKRGTYYPHRDLYREVYGELPQGFVIRHKCDERLCLNPNHLTYGTYSENSLDMFKRKRKKTKITFSDAANIRVDIRLQRVIAEEYGIDQSCVSRIKSGDHWGYEEEKPIGG